MLKPALTSLAVIATLTCGCRSAPNGAYRALPSPALHASQGGVTAQRSPTPKARRQRVEALTEYAMGLTHQLNQEQDLALDAFTISAEKGPEDPAFLIQVAHSHMAQENWTQAARLLEHGLKAASSPASQIELLDRIGLVRLQQQKFGKAIRAYQRATELDPSAIPIRLRLAEAFVLDEQRESALDTVQQAAAWLDTAGKTDSASQAQRVSLATQYYLYVKSQDGEPISTDHREAILRMVSHVSPESLAGDVSAAQRAARLFHDLGEFALARDHYQFILQGFPRLAGLRQQLVDVLLRLGDAEQARKELGVLARQLPANERVQYFLGLVAGELGDPDTAIHHWERALLLNPDFEPAYQQLASALIDQEQFDQALATLETASQKFEASFEHEYLKAMAYARQEDYPNAIRAMHTAQTLATQAQGGSATVRLNEWFYFQLGSFHERQQDFVPAASYLSKAVELNPDFSQALNYLGYMWADQGVRLEESLELIERALSHEPRNAAYLDSLAWALYRLGRFTEALGPMIMAIELNEIQDAVLWDHLGDIQAALGQSDAAIAAWRRALELELEPESNATIEKKIRQQLPEADSTSKPTPDHP